MTTMARKVLNQNEHDNMTLDKIAKRTKDQPITPVQVDQLFNLEECAYIFEDGSALINSSYNNWRIVTNYGRNVNHQDY